VLQPIRVYGSPDRDQASTRQSIVLARIPHVGAQVGAVTKSAPVDHATPPPVVESTPSASSHRSQFYVDPQHELEPATVRGRSEQEEIYSQSESQTRHFRRHDAHGRRQTRGDEVADAPQLGVANGLSRLHGEVTSYSGLILALVLAASGALLYWMIIVPGQAPMADYGSNFETIGSTDIKIPEFTRPPDPIAEEQTTNPEQLTAPVETTADSAPELIHFPEPLPPPSDEPPPVFDDASAQNYPATDYSPTWDFAIESDTQESDLEDSGEGASSSPEVARREMPATPIRVSQPK